MELDDKIRLTKNLPTIADNMEAVDLLPYLLSAFVINYDEK